MQGTAKMFGISLVIGGGLLVLLNVILTPLMPLDVSEAVLRTSTIYMLRLSAAFLAAMLLLFGCFGLYLAQRQAAGLFGKVAFLAAFVGNCLLVGVEWSNVYVMRAVAQTSPAALDALDDSTLLTVGFASAAGLFALGWILMAVSTMRTRLFARWVPTLVIVGLLSIGALGATPLGLTGAIIGNVVFGVGIMAMGRGLIRS